MISSQRHVIFYDKSRDAKPAGVDAKDFPTGARPDLRGKKGFSCIFVL